MTQLDRTSTVAQIVTANAAAARVFHQHHIDFCCHGDVTVAEACRARQLDPDAVYAELERSVGAAGTQHDDPRAIPTGALIARIVERHHAYLRSAIPFVAPLAAKVANVHGAHEPRLLPLRDAFSELAEALLPHLDHEEAVLFPALTAAPPDTRTIAAELASMYEDHVTVGRLLERMRALSDDFTTPEWGCNSYRIYMAELAALEQDVLRHVHLENHVLMPRFAAATPPHAA